MFKKKTADVSIICANYNNGKYLREFIQSVIDSSMLPYELIIVDDGSTDNSLSILQSNAHLPFLKIVSFSENKGFTASLNEALNLATGHYIARADPDDLMNSERIKLQLEFMEAHPEVDALGSNAHYFLDNPDQLINRTNFPSLHEAIYRMYHKGENALLHATAFVKAEVYQKYRYQSIFPGEDYELFGRMIRDGHRFHNLDLSLYLIRVHSSSSTTQLKYSQIAQTFTFRDKIFGTRTTAFEKRRYFLHLNYYRRYQLRFKRPTRYFWLLLSALLYPSKVVKRAFAFDS